MLSDEQMSNKVGVEHQPVCVVTTTACMHSTHLCALILYRWMWLFHTCIDVLCNECMLLYCISALFCQGMNTAACLKMFLGVNAKQKASLFSATFLGSTNAALEDVPFFFEGRFSVNLFVSTI